MITELLRPGDRVLCAVSGGADSVALLHMLLKDREKLGIELFAAHFEHGLRGEDSLRDAAFVETLCRGLAVPCRIGHGDTRAHAASHGLGIEEAARDLRYAFLERTADELGCSRIATAHTADDNAETVLFHLTRGSGAAGLSGIPRERGRIVRPLLDTTRTEIEDWLSQNGLEHREDGSNADERFSRNRLRRNVLPELKKLNPRAVEAICRSAALLARDEACLDAEAEAFLRRSYDGESLPLEAFNELHPAVASRVLRRLRPDSLSAEHVESVLAFARGSEYGLLDLPGGRLRRERGRLYPDGEDEEAPLPERILRPGDVLFLPGPGLELRSELCVREEEIHGLFKTYDLKYENIAGTVVCTGRRDGDRFHPLGRGCGKSLKALFAERGLSRRERSLVPVLRDEAGILAVPGFGQDERTAAKPGDLVLRIRWRETGHGTAAPGERE